ncbi:PadR family transcriptional regulator [Bacillus sp. V59.32b]|uniref:PadR family transcriptional regulator n=1 Tax=Bacillus sp. V59.32b TaxID=1758642 RepID=UPI000E3CDC22|nr:PadR family transcriptional regulator [Bacillus sp. V59.32b]RFU61083.1 PadR family transcriptional regulator [Bacillus sp. V59.32b]
MEDKLTRLKSAMKKHTFADLKFTENHRNSIHTAIKKQDVSREDIMIAIFRSLDKEKSGYQINESLYQKGIRNFEDNEGSLYAVLHELEQEGWLQSFWETEDRKFYSLDERAKKWLKKTESKSGSTASRLRTAFEGGGTD